MKIEVGFLFQNNASSCEESCAFLAQLQNVSSILAGDGFLPPKPSIPKVTSKNFTSISLEWDPVQNASGTAVYLVEVTFTGEQSRFSPRYLSEVNCSDITFRSASLLSLFWSSSTTRLRHFFLQCINTKLASSIRRNVVEKLVYACDAFRVTQSSFLIFLFPT